MLTCNKICFLSGVTGLTHSEVMLLSLNKAFSYHFSTHQQTKLINFKEMTAILQAIVTRIEIFKDFHLYVFYNNFVIVQGVKQTFIRGKALQSLCKIVMLYVEHDIKVQTYWISIKQNSLPNMFFHGQYTKIANNYLFLQIVQNIFEILLKTDIQKSLLSKPLPNSSSMVWLLPLGKYI